jgi:hypothetical protein
MNDYEAWRPALIAFYRADCWFQSAENVERGGPLTAEDKRLIAVLRAVVPLAPEPLRRAA